MCTGVGVQTHSAEETCFRGNLVFQFLERETTLRPSPPLSPHIV